MQMQTYPAYPILEVTAQTTDRDIFVAVISHLQKQADRCWSDQRGMCANRNSEGQACAVGALMTDDEAYGDIPWTSMAPDQQPARLRPFNNLLRTLQDIHDTSGTADDINDRLKIVSSMLGFTGSEFHSYYKIKKWNKTTARGYEYLAQVFSE